MDIGGNGLKALIGISLLAIGQTSTATEISPGSRLEKMKQAYAKTNCNSALKLGLPLVDGHDAANLPEQSRAEAYDIVLQCEYKGKPSERAYGYARRATALKGASDFAWTTRLKLEIATKRYEGAVATIEEMVRTKPTALNAFSVRSINRLHRAIEDSGRKSLRGRLLAALSMVTYAPEDLLGSNEDFRFVYAQFLADAGKQDAAGKLALGVKDPSLILELSLDRRFRHFYPADLDIRKKAEAQLVQDAKLIVQYPDKLAPLLRVARDLRLLGRFEEALYTLQGVAPRLKDPKAFSDLEENFPWWWDSIGQTYGMLGKYEEMVRSFRAGASVGDDTPNISQILNLAVAQNSFGRGKDAIRTLGIFDHPRNEPSSYGKMILSLARGCAYGLSGQQEKAAKDVAYARDNRDDAPGVLAELLLCLGDLDGAATEYIRQLDDSNLRAGALAELSDYDKTPVPSRPNAHESRLPALKARPDVQAAIKRAGGTRRFNIQRDEL